jgi:integral membrane protein (TIGR01906 family)
MAIVTATLPERLAGLATAVATAVVILAVAVLPFLSYDWVAFEQERTGAAGLTGYTPENLHIATEWILIDLTSGGPSYFDVEIDGQPVLNERERSHMLDVRVLFIGFRLIALVAAVGLVVSMAMARRLGHPERAWAAIRRGALGLAVGVIAAGAVAFFAFDAAFELFHRLFFAGGSYTFDPDTERLVQLFPFAFWFETTLAVGAVALVLSIVVAVAAGRRLARPTADPPVPALGAAETAR